MCKAKIAPAAFAMLACISLSTVPLSKARAQNGLNYTLTNSTPIAGDGNFDFLSFDDARDRLYVTRVGGVDVFDTRSQAPNLIGTVPTLPSVQSNQAVLVPEQGIGFTSSSVSRSTTIFALSTLQVLGQFALGQATDAALFDRQSGKAVFFSPANLDALVVDLVRHKVVSTIPLGAAPESAVVDPSDPDDHLYVNFPDTGTVAKIEVSEGKVVAEYKVDPKCQQNAGIAIDPDDHLLILGCAGALDFMDSRTGGNVAIFTFPKIASSPIPAYTDAVVYDAQQKNAYAPEVDGKLVGAHIVSPSQVVLLGSVPTLTGARTIAEDPGNHHIFVVASKFGTLTAGDPPSTVSNTTKVLTLAPSY